MPPRGAACATRTPAPRAGTRRAILAARRGMLCGRSARGGPTPLPPREARAVLASNLTPDLTPDQTGVLMDAAGAVDGQPDARPQAPWTRQQTRVHSAHRTRRRYDPRNGSGGARGAGGGSPQSGPAVAGAGVCAQRTPPPQSPPFVRAKKNPPRGRSFPGRVHSVVRVDARGDPDRATTAGRNPNRADPDTPS